MGRRRQKRLYDRFTEFLGYPYARDRNRRPFYGLCGARDHTYVTREDGFIYIVYHGTSIVCLSPNGDITLSTGGWRSFTTKARINEVLPRGWSLYSDLGVWYLSDPWKRKHVFADGMTIKYRGKKVIGAGQPIRPKDLKNLKAKIRNYAVEYVRRLRGWQLMEPSDTECPHCHERLHRDLHDAPPTSLQCLAHHGNTKGLGRPKGDVLGDITHIQQHIYEAVCPSSMIINAALELGAGPVARTLIVERLSSSVINTLSNYTEDVAAIQLERTLTRYLRRRYGMEA